MKKLWNKVALTGALVSGTVLGGVAMAQEADKPDFGSISSSAIDTINDLTPVVLLVGGAIVALAAVALGIRWVKATFF